ncbi:family 78 glycoside hydrolase catalytic domain [Hymenobacter properus]|uniref:alpha-L-rhamnosidase n=1 Tax=Hymenobacter properus TaxID=2791026 RepID=A0A931BEF0_9BACT|nr:family 78 glycoside hydrolase catalytic domain [Hymenobacter properus]MBF9141036.1 family 78 glycoside hydrolase catalytic domain [Hymenobacter properus]MBR7719845.1 family 78 glycoside hydrolase catalytic domain [Microvirga sp. SRT04]
MKIRPFLSFLPSPAAALLLTLIVLIYHPAAAQKLAVTNLRCEYQPHPLGVQTRTPALSWQLRTDRRNVRQTAYQILVADSPTKLNQNVGNVWDSGKIMSDASIQVSYAGRALQPATTYCWKVKTWDNQGVASGWSAPAEWQTGLFSAADWRDATWIAYEQLPAERVNVLPVDGKKDTYTGNNVLPLLRKQFEAKKQPVKATLFISGLGQFEAVLNGQKVGNHFLDPGWTKYDQQAQYVAFDVTNQVKSGANALGVMLGNGFYYVPPVKERYRKLKSAFGYPKLICRLALTYADGTQQNVVSDPSWQTTAGPVTFSSIYGGEDYNAILEQSGWATAGFDARQWRPVITVDGPAELLAQQQEPLRMFDTFKAKSTTQPQPGKWVYDFGQNASGIIELQVKGRRGDTVRIAPAELLSVDKTITQKNIGRGFYFTYVLKGSDIETWRPRFTYYGFRYAQVEGGVPKGEANPQNRPEIISLTALHTRNAAASVGEFSCSNDLLNRTNKLIDWSIKSNLASVFTDCPHREKLGWLEETHLMGASMRYGYDIATLGRKTLADMRASQTAEGLVPEIAPEYVKFEWGGDIFRDSPEWGSASIILPWYLYQWYDDRPALAENYDMMRRYVAYLGTQANGHIITKGLGDWYDLGPKPPGTSQLTPMGVTGTATYYYDLTILAQIARLLGKTADATTYEQLGAEVKTAFNQKFFNPSTKQYATGSQAANAMAVYMGLVAPADKAAVVDNIVQDIRSRDNALTAGDIGYRYLLRVLEDAGRSDVIFAMNSRTDVPGYGYQLAHGATALTESWAALPTVSNNHLMLGHLQEWLYGGLAGIRPAEGSVAFNHIDIKPEPVGDVTSAKASHQSPYGLIASDWKKSASGFALTVTIPANATATVYLPAAAGARISEGGQPLAQHPELQSLGIDQGRARIKVGSGTYHFEVNSSL